MTETVLAGMSLQTDPRVLTANLKAHNALGGVPTTFEDALMPRAGLTAEEARLLFFQQQATWQVHAQTIRALTVLTSIDQVGLNRNLRRVYAEIRSVAPGTSGRGPATAIPMFSATWTAYWATPPEDRTDHTPLPKLEPRPSGDSRRSTTKNAIPTIKQTGCVELDLRRRAMYFTRQCGRRSMGVNTDELPA